MCPVLAAKRDAMIMVFVILQLEFALVMKTIKDWIVLVIIEIAL